VASDIHTNLATRVSARIRDVPDFPQPGILFKDITPVLAEGALLREVVERIAEEFGRAGIQRIAGIESRGFILGAPLAVRLGVGFTPIRKPGKLPYETRRVDYALEYGTDALEAHVDAVQPGDRVLLVDDVLATGGTASGAVRLIRELGGDVVATAFLIELAFLHGRQKLHDVPVFSLIEYGS
jgi:adenine phosphoribosyltransferase